ncbi:hypothetical protein [Couchioplanes azureus]|uniref:hypothetical protein n=1 Tax=Couchioplanes caeruleus TaxID=56438 RepID=UPI001670F7BD|nr:hypothetical protein [Couchioplanes caeruleus]GGQ86512.1 hypothetical protein GCM10010166_65770 [Couchioplanes caeruleus subsp. azureus]
MEQQTATASELSRSLTDASTATSHLADAVAEVADGATETDQGVHTVRGTSTDLATVSRTLADVVDGFITA